MGFRTLSWMAAAGSLALAAGSAQAGTQIVDISGLGSGGTIVALAAGSYSIKFINNSANGGYAAYSPWSFESGCNASGENCATGWSVSLAIDFGFGTGNFSHSDGFQYGQLATQSDSHLYATAEQALASIQSANLVRAPLPQVTDQNAYVPTGNPISFTLAAAQSVNFFIYDYPYNDNRGGVSILLDDGINPNPAVPEPASWAMLIAGLGVVGAAMRRRRAEVGFA
ncbi:MAG TPA: PEPxxWA-CTERM sorting domain-containing protein [Sphingobium sp.]